MRCFFDSNIFIGMCGSVGVCGCVCVCACVRACTRGCGCVCVCACARAHVCEGGTERGRIAKWLAGNLKVPGVVTSVLLLFP